VKSDGVTLYAVGVGKIPEPWRHPFLAKRAKEALQYIMGLDGFVIFSMVDRGTACLFETRNDAVRAKNLMDAKGIVTGREIGEVTVDKKILEEALTNGR